MESNVGSCLKVRVETHLVVSKVECVIMPPIPAFYHKSRLLIT